MAFMKMTPPKEETLVLREVGTEEIQLSITGTQTDGKPIAVKSTSPRQGGATKIQEGPLPEGMTIVSTRIDPNNSYATYMMNGKQVFVSQNAVSKNGKSMRVTMRGTDAQGKPFEQLAVFVKQ
jgi:hypothetical protein